MKNEKIKDRKDPEIKPASARIGSIALSIINPISDLKIIHRAGIKPILDRISNLNNLSNSNDSKAKSLSFEQAVQVSGRSVTQLKKRYVIRQLFWYLLMMLSMSISMAIVVLSCLASDLPIITLLRGLSWAMILASFSFFCFAACLKSAYRRWQLVNEKVSIEEGGTFSDFMQEDNQILEVLCLRIRMQKGKKP